MYAYMKYQMHYISSILFSSGTATSLHTLLENNLGQVRPRKGTRRTAQKVTTMNISLILICLRLPCHSAVFEFPLTFFSSERTRETCKLFSIHARQTLRSVFTTSKVLLSTLKQTNTKNRRHILFTFNTKT